MNDVLQLALNKCTSSFYIVTSHLDGKINRQISDAIIQAESVSIIIILSISKKKLTYEYIKKIKAQLHEHSPSYYNCNIQKNR